MSIAPLAILGTAQAAYSLFGAESRSAAVQKTSSLQGTAVAQESIWHQLGQQLNVSSMTKDELSQVATDLYSNNAISMQDYMALVSDTSALQTSADAQGKVNWMAEFQARLTRHQSLGDQQGVQTDQSILDVLNRLSAGARGVISIHV